MISIPMRSWRDKEEWKTLIEDAKPIVTHVMETLAAGKI
jgi:hypothetical protein